MLVNRAMEEGVFVLHNRKKAYFAFSSEYTHHILRFVVMEGEGGHMPLKFEFTGKMLFIWK